MAVGAAEQLDLMRRGEALEIRFSGAWTLDTAVSHDRRLRAVAAESAQSVVIDASDLTALDSAGAWVLRRTAEALLAKGADVALRGLPERYTALVEKAHVEHPEASLDDGGGNRFVAMLEHCGVAVVETLAVGRDLLGFFGLTLVQIARILTGRSRLRAIAFLNQLEHVGLNAIPIVVLLCFLVGVVLAYMGALQLERFGAAILTVNLVGISVLREIGVLLTAIIVAGRSGSAFAAQIGTMKVNQEIDAMETLGLSPIEVLVLPRVLGLVVALPLLVFVGDIAGLAGGAVIAWAKLGMTMAQYLEQLHQAVGLWTFGVGMIKAPVFAYVIALVGCHEGLQVSGSAESVGVRTTRSVVESIFLVIVLDAAFSVFFAELGV